MKKIDSKILENNDEQLAFVEEEKKEYVQNCKNDFKAFKRLAWVFILLIVSCIIIFVFVPEKQEKEVIQEIIIVLDYTNYELAINHIKEYEGLKLTPYQLLPDTNYYIGYGYQMSDSSQFISITEQQADSLLKLVFNEKLLYLHNKYGFIGNRLLAVSLLTYRWGQGNLINSKLIKAIISNDEKMIEKEWLSINLFNVEVHDKISKRADFEFRMFNN